MFEPARLWSWAQDFYHGTISEFLSIRYESMDGLEFHAVINGFVLLDQWWFVPIN